MKMKKLVDASITVESASIAAYAELTNDFNPIHLDPEFAAQTVMGGIIAHGTLSICLLWQSIFRTFGSREAAGAEIDVRFVKPVRQGETLHAGGELEGDDPSLYHVWVRGGDGSERVRGTLRLALAPVLAESA